MFIKCHPPLVVLLTVMSAGPAHSNVD